MSQIDLAAKRFNTVPSNISVFRNPDSSIVYHKTAEYDSDGNLIGEYKPIITKLGYLLHSLKNGGEPCLILET